MLHGRLIHGWALANRALVERNLDTVKRLLNSWDIAALADGWKIDGAGYGHIIQRLGPGECPGHSILVRLR